MTRQEKKEELLGLFSTGAIFIGDLIDECFEFGQQHPHWISVEDELPLRFPLNPNESMNVITYGLHTMVNWYDYERGEWVRDSEITHWMPLPQAPMEGE